MEKNILFYIKRENDRLRVENNQYFYHFLYVPRNVSLEGNIGFGKAIDDYTLTLTEALKCECAVNYNGYMFLIRRQPNEILEITDI